MSSNMPKQPLECPPHGEGNRAMRAETGDGYVTEIDYTHRYYAYLAPARLALACSAGGIGFTPSFPPPRQMRYLELAFGQGESINIFAAASPGEYWGIDFNPRH